MLWERNQRALFWVYAYHSPLISLLLFRFVQLNLIASNPVLCSWAKWTKIRKDCRVWENLNENIKTQMETEKKTETPTFLHSRKSLVKSIFCLFYALNLSVLCCHKWVLSLTHLKLPQTHQLTFSVCSISEIFINFIYRVLFTQHNAIFRESHRSTQSIFHKSSFEKEHF